MSLHSAPRARARAARSARASRPSTRASAIVPRRRRIADQSARERRRCFFQSCVLALPARRTCRVARPAAVRVRRLPPQGARDGSNPAQSQRTHVLTAPCSIMGRRSRRPPTPLAAPHATLWLCALCVVCPCVVRAHAATGATAVASVACAVAAAHATAHATAVAAAAIAIATTATISRRRPPRFGIRIRPRGALRQPQPSQP